MSDNAVSSRGCGSGIARLWRGWIVAVLAVLLAAGGHQTAHSITHGAVELIPWELFGLSAALTAPIAVAMASKRLAMWSTGVTTLIGQLAFHVLYSLPYTSTSHVAQGHQHGHHAMPPLMEAQAAHTTHAASHTLTANAVMLLAHILAAALTTWIIAYGERSLMTIAGWVLLRPAALVLAALPDSITRPKAVLPAGEVWLPSSMYTAHPRWTRGPPVLV